MCTAAEAKTLQRVYGRYNSFFRKVIPIKRVQKPYVGTRDYQCTGIPGVSSMVMLGVFSLILQVGGAQLAGRCSSSFLSPYLMMRPVRTLLRSYRGTHPLGRSALSLLRCGERPRGYPDVASGRCAGTLRPWGRERLPGKRGRTRIVPQRGKAVSSERDIRVPEAKRGRVPL